MLITNQKVKVKWGGKNKKYYESKGYIYTGSKNEFEVNTNDLSPASKSYVKIQCDYCGIIFEKRYQNYMYEKNKNIINKDCCKKCTPLKNKESCLKRFGVENQSQSEEAKNKRKQTMLQRYGVENYTQTEEYKEKSKQTNLKKYGVENYTQTEEYKEKSKQTCLNKYGVEYPAQSEKIKEKTKQTNLERYGVETPSQNKEIQDKIKQTNLKKYGVEFYCSTSEFKEKVKQTNLDKYGVENVFQSEEIKDKMKQTWLNNYGVDNPLKAQEVKEKSKQTMLEKYNVINPGQSLKIKEKVKHTNLDKYEVEYYFQSEEFKKKYKQTMLNKYDVENIGQYEPLKKQRIIKGRKTMYENDTAPKGRQQIYICNLLKGELNYPIDVLNLDIAFPNEMIYIEYDGSGHGWYDKKYTENGEQIVKQHDLKRTAYLKNKGWKIIRIYSNKDWIPQDEDIIKLVDKAKNYLLNTKHTWVEIDIDKKEYKCSQYIEKIELNNLRKITDRDLF